MEKDEENLSEDSSVESIEENEQNWRTLNKCEKYDTKQLNFDYNNENIKNMKYDCPSDMFRLFLDKEIIEFIKDCTNTKLKKENEKNKLLDETDILNYIAVIFHISVKKFPTVYDHWSTAGFFVDPLCANIMSIGTYKYIHKHFTIYSSCDKGKPNTKVNEFFSYINLKFLKYTLLSQHVSIDESLVHYKGRTLVKQYMPMKPGKWGLKFFCLADSKCAYLHQFILYTGKLDFKVSKEGLVKDVVKRLADTLPAKGFHIYTDNFYTSFGLYQSLHENGFGATGTIRANRGGPKDLANPEKKETIFAKKEDCLFARYHDKKMVNAISTVYGNEKQYVLNNIEVKKPLILSKYSMGMGGVDLVDQHNSYYKYRHASKKWWRVSFYFVLENILLNSYLVYKSNLIQNTNLLSRLEYKILVISKIRTDRNSRQRNSMNGTVVNGMRHFPIKDEESSGRCSVCHVFGKRKVTNIMCSDCKVHLCIGYCYEKYQDRKSVV